MQGQADTNRIFIGWVQGSGGYGLDIQWVYDWVRRILGGCLFSVCRSWGNYRLNIHSVFEWIRRITDQIFIRCMQESGGLPSEYPLCVWMGQADYQLDIHLMYVGIQWDYWLNIHLVYAGIRWDYWLNIHLVYAGVRRITNWISIVCMNGSGGLPTKYLFGVCRDPAGLLNEYSFGIRRGQADYQLITDQILSDCINGSGGWPIRYSFGVCTVTV